MKVALWLLAMQGVLGAFDTIYYHEWLARLPGRVPQTAVELKLHALRDFLYGVIFASLPWIAWQGLWVAALAAVLLAEIVLTMADFIVEITARKSIGDVFAGERVTHAAMGILYGAMTANLIPVLFGWWSLPTSLAAAVPDVPVELRWALSFMAIGVCLSGVRDLYAALGLPYGNWPWHAELLEPMGKTP
jgi:hypothetical protein